MLNPNLTLIQKLSLKSVCESNQKVYQNPNLNQKLNENLDASPKPNQNLGCESET